MCIFLSAISSFPLTIELQQNSPHCFVLSFEPNSKVNVHYSLYR